MSDKRNNLARRTIAALVLAAAVSIIAWCFLFAIGSFGRELQFEAERATWEGVRAFATIGTLVVDGLLIGALLVSWAVTVLSCSTEETP